MKKEEILKRLKELPYPKEEYWLITGAAMVVYGMREETHDIDLGCSKKLADQLEKDGYLCRKNENGKRSFQIGGTFEIFEEWKTGTLQWEEDCQLLSPEGLIAMKSALGRQKDLRDIALIRAWLSAKEKEG